MIIFPAGMPTLLGLFSTTLILFIFGGLLTSWKNQQS